MPPAAPTSHAFSSPSGVTLVVHDWGGDGDPVLLAHPTGYAEIWYGTVEGPRITLSLIKKNVNTAERGDLVLSFDTEAANHSRSGETEDHKEASKAFVEKRQPVFKGR